MSHHAMIIGLVTLLALLPQADAANTTLYSEKIWTVCQINEFIVTKAGEKIRYCPLLPDRTEDNNEPGKREFFEGINNNKFFEKKCDDTANQEPEIRNPTSFQKSFDGLQNLLKEITNGIKIIKGLLIDAALDVTKFSLITKNWNWFIYFPSAIFMSLVFFGIEIYIIQDNNKLVLTVFLNVVKGFVLIAVAYVAHLYFKNIYIWVVLWAYTFFVLTPWFPKTPLSGLGILTIIWLIVPLVGVVAFYAFQTTLFFGPAITNFINLCSLSLHLLCFAWLYIDEKLVIVRTLFLPLIKSIEQLTKKSNESQQEIDLLQQKNENMTRDMFTSFQYTEPIKMNGWQKFDKIMTDTMRKFCDNATDKLKTNDFPEYKCGWYFYPMCMSGTFQQGGGVAALGFFLCPIVSTKACQFVGNKATDVCNKVQNGSMFTILFGEMAQTLEKIRSEIVVDPNIAPKKAVIDDVSGFNLFQASWTWWLHIVLEFGALSFVYGLLIPSVLQALPFLTAYKSNDNFNNNYLSNEYIESQGSDIKLSRKDRRRYVAHTRKALKDYIRYMWNNKPRFILLLLPLIMAIVAFAIDRSASYFHDMLMKVDFVVPVYGEVKFLFNVEGTSALASLIKSTLGAFSFKSTVCSVTDSKVCATGFKGVEWPVWVKLLVLYFFYFAVRIYQTKSNYIMCVVLDFLKPERARDRGNFLLRKIREAQFQEREVRVKAARRRGKEIKPIYSHDVDNDKVAGFFLKHRWVVTYLPNILACFIAWIMGASFIYCQWCGNDLVTHTFPCRTFLICEDCAFYVRHCPCSKNICKRDLDDKPYDDQYLPPQFEV